MDGSGFRHPPLSPGQIDAPHLHADLGDLRLESGEVIHDFRQSYVIHGKLSANRSNAILVCASLTGNHHRLDFLIGPGLALDPDHYCIIATDPIGNGLSTSPSNSARQPGMAFPRFAIRDMVHAQYRLLVEALGIRHLHAVVGASMGGMQALQWAVSHADFMTACVAMTPMARTSPWTILVTETARSCLMADPAWDGTRFTAVPERGWRAYAGLMSVLLSRTPKALDRTLDGLDAAHQWFERSVRQIHLNAFDATDYLYQSWAYEAHDVGTTPGYAGTETTLTAVKARALVLAPPLDLFNPVESAHATAAAIPRGHFVEIPSVQGHQAATSLTEADAEFLNQVIREFL
ncbi:MAG: alpha/beta fold hydrolase [Burkholderiales bacterium]|nr:alpha/beta fold hydrolase [Burkholderiales bacterium]